MRIDLKIRFSVIQAIEKIEERENCCKDLAWFLHWVFFCGRCVSFNKQVKIV